MPSDSTSADSIWLSALRASGRSPKTLESYAAAVAMLRAWRTNDPDLTTVTRFEALAFVKQLGEQYRPGVVALRVRSLRAMFGWLLLEEMVESNPFARITITVPAEAKPNATDEQIESMLASAKGNRRDLALLVVLVETGCRRRRTRLGASRRRGPDLGDDPLPGQQERRQDGPPVRSCGGGVG